MRYCKKEMVENLKRELLRQDTTCLIWQEEVGYINNENCTKCIIDSWSKGFLKDAIVIDKFIGKDSAVFLAEAKVSYAYGMKMSKLAEEVLKAHEIEYFAESVVDNIAEENSYEEEVKNINSIDESIEIILGKTC